MNGPGLQRTHGKADYCIEQHRGNQPTRRGAGSAGTLPHTWLRSSFVSA